jgi:hypothetical protein
MKPIIKKAIVESTICVENFITIIEIEKKLSL